MNSMETWAFCGLLTLVNICMLQGCASESEDWSRVQQAKTSDQYEAFLRVYPQGEFAPAARERLSQLRKQEERQNETKRRAEALLRAIVNQDMAQVQHILALDPGLINTHIADNGGTPLHCAAQNSTPQMVELLLAKGAEIDGLDPNRSTPLFWAVRSGNEGTARVLLDRGANANASDVLGMTVLAWVLHGKGGTMTSAGVTVHELMTPEARSVMIRLLQAHGAEDSGAPR